eukprot:2564251-Pyramimonas_sp.AAC.1
MDESDAGYVGILSRWTNQTQATWVYYHDGPIRRGRREYVLSMDQRVPRLMRSLWSGALDLPCDSATRLRVVERTAPLAVELETLKVLLP